MAGGGGSFCALNRLLVCLLMATQSLAAPVFLPGPATQARRIGSTATLLPNGTVLVVSGDAQTTSEVYDPFANTWTLLTTPGTEHLQHGAVLLPDLRLMVLDWGPSNELLDLRTSAWSAAPVTTHHVDRMGCYLRSDGMLLQLGGNTVGGDALQVTTFDPATNTWTPLAATPRNLVESIYAPLLDDRRVLVAGGFEPGNPVRSAWLFDVMTRMWTPLPDMALGRVSGHGLTLGSGRVLVFGGDNPDTPQLLDPVSLTWLPAGSTVYRTDRSGAVMLPNGNVLVVGGFSLSTNSQVYLASGNTWQSGPSMAVVRESPTATVLPNGRVLVQGGTAVGVTSTDLYDLGPGTWLSNPPGLSTPRERAQATPLPDGFVLLTGGSDGSGPLASAVRVSLAVGGMPAASMSAPRQQHAAALLPDGRVYISGGLGVGGAALSSTEVYDPVADTWAASLPLSAPRAGHTATVLPDGRVLIAGGGVAACELFDPRRNTLSPAAALTPARTGHRAHVLPDRRVLITGGGLAATALYNSATDSWSPGGSLLAARTGATATFLPDGRLFVAGGGSSSTELFAPLAGTSTLGPAMAAVRNGHEALLLRSGKVLIAGGGPAGSATAELFDPLTLSLVAVPTPSAARSDGVLIPAGDGRVLFAGGRTAAGVTSQVELYDEGWAPPAAFIPTLAPLTSLGAGRVRLTGATFRGATLGADASFLGSPSNFPLLSLQPLHARPWMALTVSFTPTTAVAELPAGVQPGWHRARVIVSGVSSEERLWLAGAPGAACTGPADCATGLCTSNLCCDPACAPGACSGFCGGGVDGGGMDGGQEVDGGQSDGPLRLRVGCGCQGDGWAAAMPFGLLICLAAGWRCKQRTS